MAKKQETTTTSDQRQTRKEVLLARKQAQQTRQIRIGVAIVGGLLLVVFLAAVINELIVAPNRAVAIVNEEEISLSDWQDRVRFERAQRIILLENQLEAFQNNVGVVQQFAGQTINELLQNEQLGQAALNQMIDEVIIRQAAEARGITVTDEDVQNEIEETFSFYDGGLPTPLPTATATVEPTPSITPLPTAVITEVLPTNTPIPTATLAPTGTAAPTATPVSAEAFQQEFSDFMTEFEALGVSEELYREIVRSQLYREQLLELLADEDELSDEAEQVSFYVLQFNTEEEANEAEALVADQGFLPVWNEVRSIVPDPESGSTAVASEVLWRTQAATVNSLGAEVAEAAFELPIGEPSSIISRTVDAQTTRYYLIQLSGKEVRPLSASEYQTLQLENLAAFIDEQLAVGGLTLTEYDRGRTPTNPVLDPIFTTPPTATPAVPTGG
ncbi:SurA N-terminal domain-containing protein [Candidatus Leptofilum sp.]|uniref:SurA N-terminal domain-containing protein n=1 Tax=Candidatus Leptofilum sp. TaxID=3241576 RepID=UPI003B5BB47E